jgi:anti-sigma regulatory factor (Ser/Thr protein kinase)/predicted hydrocarbon binding protein
MIRVRLYAFLKKLFSSSRSETYILISGWLTAFFVIFMINSIFGIYSIYGMSNDLTKNLMGINLARNAQIALHEQVLAWENILISGKNYTDYQVNYHEFSWKAMKVENILFNLKLENSGNEEISAEIEKLRGKHKKITSEFISHVVDMGEKKFSNVTEKVILTKGKEDELLNNLNSIAERIESEGYNQSSYIINRYRILAAVLSIILITLLIYYGRRIGRRLLKTNNILEEMVQERTKDYVEANLSLKQEIDEHKITGEKLIVSKNEVEEKNALLTVSEKKYRHIVEGTREIIFTLDESWRFKTANDAIKAEFKISPEAVTKYTLTDLIYDELTDATILRKIITEKLEESRKNSTPVRFNAQIKTPNLIEPVEFKITLEFIEIEGLREIIGKAVRISDDRFSEFFISEKCEYLIKNLLFTADDISHRITDNLQKYMDKTDITSIRIGLREIIINSIEHGNLNISFEEKTEAILNDRYFEFINERQSNPDHRDKRVRIEYLISASKAIYKVTDQGKGFNHRKFLSGLSDDPAEMMLAHGRGISMVKSIFDEVRYNSKGNQVLLVKHINKNRGREADENRGNAEQLQLSEIS